MLSRAQVCIQVTHDGRSDLISQADCLRALFAIQVRPLAGIPNLYTIQGQRLGGLQLALNARRRCLGESEKLSDVVRSWRLRPETGQERLEILFGGLLCVKAHGIVRYAVSLHQLPRDMEVLVGLPEPPPHKIPGNLIRVSHR